MFFFHLFETMWFLLERLILKTPSPLNHLPQTYNNNSKVALK